MTPNDPNDTNYGGTGQPRRFYELDSLRGLAAAIVVFDHFDYLVPPRLHSAIDRSPLKILVNGHNAVILFFVLSGFVLTRPYVRRSALQYRDFLLKRVCRIYLPYLAALALSILADALSPNLNGELSSMPGSNRWIDQTWSQPITVWPVFQHILFIGHYPTFQFNAAFWSLVYEMRISLAFPFIALAVLRWRPRRTLAAALLVWVGSILLNHFGPALLHGSPDNVGDVASTLFYAVFFILGALLAKKLHTADAWFRRRNALEVAALAIASILLFGYAAPLLAQRHLPAGAADLCTGLGTLGLIVLAVNCDPLQRFLTSPAIHHLGKISYSLYLMHGTVLFILIHTLFGRVPLPVLFALYLGLTLAATEVFHRLIELPTMHLGRRLTAARPPRQQSSGQPVLT